MRYLSKSYNIKEDIYCKIFTTFAVLCCLKCTVRGMMYYRKALMLQTYLERTTAGGKDKELHGFPYVSMLLCL